MYPYVSVAELRKIDIDSESPKHDEILTSLIHDASRDFEYMCRDRVFYPYRDVKSIDLHKPVINTTLFLPNSVDAGYSPAFSSKSFYWRMSLPEDLNKVIDVRINGERLLPTEYILRSGSEYSAPYTEIDIDPKVSFRLTFGDASKFKSSVVEIDGYWGYVGDWKDHLIDSLATIEQVEGNEIKFSQSSVNVLGASPSIDAMRMYIVEENYTDSEDFSTRTRYEFIYVVKEIHRPENKFFCVRNYLGSEHIENLVGKKVYEFTPMRGIKKAVRRLSAWYYRQRGSSNPDMDRPILTNAGLIMPATVPSDVSKAIETYIRVGGISTDTVNREVQWAFE